VFGDIFGGGRRGGRSQVFRGADLRYELELDLNQAVFGAFGEIDVPKLMRVRDLQWQGAAKGSNARAPATPAMAAARCACHAGLLPAAAGLPALPWHAARSSESLRHLPGPGARAPQDKKLAVKIPAGVDNGDRIRLSGEGEAGRNGGPPGDLYVEITCASTRSSSATASTCPAKCR
jgi:molecular chaperone DnaJ